MPDSLDNLQQEKASNGEQEETSKNTEDTRQIHGLLVSYKDDGIDESIHCALQNKKRVHYKCMDVISNFVGLGTSVGAIYLFRLASITHTSCSESPHVIACDQGPIEVIKFVPGGGGGPNSLLVVIGTARGSIVIFQLSFADHNSVQDQEIYRAVEFTRSEFESSIGIKLIEYDQDLFDPCAQFTKLYICDQRNRIFVLEEASINPGFRLLHSHKPAPILSVNESTVHQICVHRSQLLLSTDEKAHLFSEYSNELLTIGQRQRKTKGFFGACFYNKYFKPARLQPPSSSSLAAAHANRLSAYSQQTVYSSTASLAELEQLLVFVARPKFSLWRVNSRRDVEFTHMFREPIRHAMTEGRRRKIVELHNEPLSGAPTPGQVETNNNNNNNQGESGRLRVDNHASISEAFGANASYRGSGGGDDEMPKCDHFEKLVPLFSSTLGNLLLSYTRHEIYVIDPIGAQLIVCHAYERPIQQVCCSENEIFVMLELGKRQTRVERIVLLAPTQFVLELHRLNRFLSLAVFVQLFKSQFKRLMALPLSGPNTITTEGGLLRNIIWNTWREMGQKLESDLSWGPNFELDCSGFKELVDTIMDESRQFKQSLENLADSRLLFTTSHENLERLCSEPYASMVSLDISIANLHTNHVVHFSQEALNRHKSLAKLSQSIMNLSQLQKSSATAAAVAGSARSSLLDLTSQQMRASRELLAAGASDAINFNDKRVIVEPLRPRINLKDRQNLSAGLSLNKIDEVAPNQDDELVTPVGELAPSRVDGQLNEEQQAQTDKQDEQVQAELAKDQDDDDPTRCPECKWPRARAHLKPMHHSQQIQFGWLQENLLPNFEENIEQIEERAFKHGLWHVVLRCLAFKNQLDDYVRCCLMLDDVTLLNAKRFIITRGCSEDELIDLVFKQLEHKLDFLGKLQRRNDDEQEIIMCLKCGHQTVKRQPNKNCDHLDDDDDDESSYQGKRNDADVNDDDNEDELSFNLVGLFKILLRKSADIKRAISILLQYPSLLEKSEIPATFYLEALGLYPRPHRVGTA